MRRALIVVAALVSVFLDATPLQAQRYTYRQYDSMSGLTDMAVHCLLQDRAGFIWVGTDNGLFRYEGARFRAYHAEDGLPHPTIRALAESPQGAIWVGTNDGIARFNGSRFQPVEFGGQGHVLGLAFDSAGRLYVQSQGGLIRGIADDLGNYHFTLVSRGVVRGIFVHKEEVWFLRDKDLWRLRGEAEEKVGSPYGLPNDQWTSVTQDTQGNLWVASESLLFERISGQPRFQQRKTDLPKTIYNSLYSDPWGRVYLSTYAGVAVFDGGDQMVLNTRHGLPAESITSAMLDREGSLWLGGMGSGLFRQLGRGDWLSWNKEDGLMNDIIWAIHHDRSGQTWIGSNGGVNVIDSHGRIVRSWKRLNGNAASEVHSLAEGPRGQIFAATYPNGISWFDRRGTLSGSYHSRSVLAAGWLQTITIDDEGRLWAGGAAGCFRSRRQLGDGELELDPVTIDGLEKGTEVFEFLIDGDILWAATSHGLCRLSHEKWRIFTQKDGLTSDAVSVLAKGEGALWVAYEDGRGLSQLVFEGDHIKTKDFTRRNGLASDEVFGIAFDVLGRLWASTDAGVDLLDHGRWMHIGREDGLIWVDTDSLALEADRDGNVWIGTSAGVSRYSLPRMRGPDEAPPVVLTGIDGESRSWHSGEKPALPFSQSSLKLNFAALHYAEEDHLRFRYRLAGYETAWHDTSERSVHFERLPAGEYQFQVLASGPEDLWSTQPAVFAFSVTPPWWQTWWVLLASIGLLLLGLRAIHDLRVRVLVERTNRLERLVASRTAELTESHRRLEEMAYCDMLTRLPNRREFSRRLDARIGLARRHADSFALLLTDLDHFKNINDQYGHDAGDKVLIETATRLTASVRKNDCVARLGGDEFAIVLFSASDLTAVLEICNRIIKSSSLAIDFNGQSLVVGSSVGVALYPQDGETEESLYKAADTALYAAKRRRSSYSFTPSARES